MHFLITAMAMIFTEATGVIAVLIDGIIASQFFGEELYAGISQQNLLQHLSGYRFKRINKSPKILHTQDQSGIFAVENVMPYSA